MGANKIFTEGNEANEGGVFDRITGLTGWERFSRTVEDRGWPAKGRTATTGGRGKKSAKGAKGAKNCRPGDRIRRFPMV